ncbi:MAG: hypothetical protein QME73_01330, partial [Bacillota bacterium]|nr:hypothetical protein [Bacillota bacterium]
LLHLTGYGSKYPNLPMCLYPKGIKCRCWFDYYGIEKPYYSTTCGNVRASCLIACFTKPFEKF